MAEKSKNYLEEIKLVKKQLQETESKYQEAKLEIKNFQYLTSNISDIIWILDPIKQKFTYISQSVEKVLGYTSQECIDTPISDFFTPDSINLLQEMINVRLPKFIECGEKINYTDNFTLIHKDSSEVYTEVISYLINNKTTGKIDVVGTARDITQRNETDTALKESELLLKEAQKIAHLGHWELDIVNNNLIWSDEIYRNFDLMPQEFEATYEAFIDKIHPDDRDMVNEAYTNSLKNKAPYEIEHRLLLKNEKIKYVIEKCKTEYDKKGMPLRSIGTVQDITEQKKAQLQLSESEEKFRTVVTNSIPIIFMYDMEGNILLSEGKMLSVFGLKPGETVGNNIFESYKDYPDVINALKLPLKGKPFEGNIKFGDLIFDAFYSPYKDAQGNVIGAIGVTLDITEQKKAQQKLQESEKKYRLLVENGPSVFWIIDKDTKPIYVSPNLNKILGFSPDELYNKGSDMWSERIHEQDYKNVITQFNLIFTENKPHDVTYRLKHKNGNWIWFHNIGEKHINDSGEEVAYGIAVNITDRKNAQQKLQESEAKYQLLVENGPSVFWVTDKNGKTKYISPNISKIYGFSADEIYKNGTEAWLDRIHKQDIENVLTNFNSVFTENKRFEVTYRIKNKKGKWIWLQDVGEKYINDIGEELAYGVFTDITEKMQAQQKIYYAMMNAEERERSRVAKELHDGASPVLAAIKLYIQSLLNIKDESKKKELTVKIEQTISEAIQSISEISNKLSPHILQNFGLKAAVESFTRKIEEFKKLKISLEYKIEDRFSENIEVALYRITTELINNTLKYARAKNISIQYNIDDEFVQMKYTDDGVGFNPEKTLKIKKGMGIFNMTNRIKSLNGQFYMNSQPNKGIEVEISVPMNE